MADDQQFWPQIMKSKLAAHRRRFREICDSSRPHRADALQAALVESYRYANDCLAAVSAKQVEIEQLRTELAAGDDLTGQIPAAVQMRDEIIELKEALARAERDGLKRWEMLSSLHGQIAKLQESLAQAVEDRETLARTTQRQISELRAALVRQVEESQRWASEAINARSENIELQRTIPKTGT